MQLVEKHIIKRSHPNWAECDRLCKDANTIRNQALYVQRQSWFYGHGVVNFGKAEEHRNIDALMKSYPCYHALPAFLAQQVVKSLNAEWTGFFNALKEWKVNPSQFTGRPKPPNYKPRTGRYKVEYPNTRALKNFQKKGIIHLYCSNIQIQTSHALNYDCVRIFPATGCYVIEVVYTVEDVPVREQSFVAAMDLGVNILGAVTSNKLGFQPILINGRPVKSINNRYNRTISEIKCINKKLHGIDWSGRMELLTRRENLKVDSYLHRASSLVIKTLIRERISTLVIGLNPDWKRNLNIGINNQQFAQIPHRKFVDMLIYKGAINKIKVYTRDEAYTSKSSFLDLDIIPDLGNKPENWKPSGKRIKRGLYKSKSGLIIQSDVNASYNILRKEFPDAFSQGIKGCVVELRLVNIPGFTAKPASCRICYPV